jgi:hypothetical protein
MFIIFIVHVAKLGARYECLVYTRFTIYQTVLLIYLFLFVMQLHLQVSRSPNLRAKQSYCEQRSRF